MFKKIVSNLSFSPALVGQLAFYAKRLKKEEATRRIGLIFVVLALVVQSLAVFQPSTSANAASSSDFVPGGLGLGSSRSINNFLKPYDVNYGNLKDIMNYMGITRAQIAGSTFTSWTVGNTYSWGRQPQFSYAQGERAVAITNSAGKTVTTIYARPNKLFNGASAKIYGWVGYSSRVGWFAIMQACGNLVTNIIPAPPKPPVKVTPPVVVPPKMCALDTSILASSSECKACAYNASIWYKSAECKPPVCIYNGSILASSAECKACPGNANLWINDKMCIPNIVETKTALNVTQGNVDATTVTADGGDQITYTITVKNTGLAATTVPLQDHLEDTLEYSTLTDNGGGTFDTTTQVLSWPSISLAPGASQSRTFSVQVINPVPATPQGTSNLASYDCVMSNVFGNDVQIKVNCPAPKVVETVATELPHTGPTENMLFAGIVLAIAVYFYARARQVKKEVRLIRRSVNTGTI